MKTKKLAIILGTILILILVIPPIAYVSFFWNSSVSTDPQNWGVFGDYLGGILNPIISLASLCILGYLTYLVSIQNVKENKKLFILEKRMEAYQELTKYFKEINMITDKIAKSNALLPIIDILPQEKKGEELLRVISEQVETCYTFKEFYFTLSTFNVKYSHLFKYDFSSAEFEDFTKETKAISDDFDGVISGLTGEDKAQLKISAISERFQSLAVKVINDIRKEVLAAEV